MTASTRRWVRAGGILVVLLALLFPTHATAAPPVTGAIGDTWQRVRPMIGDPLEPQFCGLQQGGCAQRFQRGSIYWTQRTGAQEIRGAIRDVWGANGWERGISGYPTSGEFCGLREGGCGQRFQNGNIYFHPRLGTHRVFGAIFDGWARVGWETSTIGYPVAGESCGLAGRGCSQRFANGFMYWSPASGSFAVTGRILDHWAANGRQAGRYGYPTSNESCRTEGGVRICDQNYQRGRITWRSDRGIVTQSAATTTPVTRDPAPARSQPGGRVDCSVQRCVALTYDDGPGVHTNRLLDTLGRNDAKATFFLVGDRVPANAATVRRMRDMGMEIGNHSRSHPTLTGLGSAGIRSQLADTQGRIRAAAGVTPTVFRPPYGARNATVDSAAREQGLSVIMWSVDTMDWRDRNSSTVTSRVLNQAQPGSIILMHDIHSTTVDAAPAIVSGLKAKGFVLVTVSELLNGTDPGRVYSAR
ncbi:MAG: polysaccharide deacetylase family protein [Propionibacteriaceae bacterium]|nr:polysaccharide deacetylase family protein [Propionibacteriaceae bacterium]